MKNFLPPSFWPSVQRLITNETWPPRTPEGARRLVEACSRHALLPLLFAEPALPRLVEEARDDARGWIRILDLRARSFRDTIVSLCDVLAGEPVILLKGADYAHRIYPSAGLRPMQDIDLLVPADRIDALGERLVRAGLVRKDAPGATRDPAHHERGFTFGKMLVELHQSFIQRPRHRIDYDGIWERRVTVEIHGRRAFRLDDVDALLYHTLSMAKDEFRVRLVRYVDLWLLLGQREGIACAAAERAREWQTARAFYGALSLACRYFPEFRTDDVRAAMERVARPRTRLFVDACVLPRPSELRSRASGRWYRVLQLWRKALLMDTPRRRVAFALSHAVAALRCPAPREVASECLPDVASRRS